MWSWLNWTSFNVVVVYTNGLRVYMSSSTCLFAVWPSLLVRPDDMLYILTLFYEVWWLFFDIYRVRLPIRRMKTLHSDGWTRSSARWTRTTTTNWRLTSSAKAAKPILGSFRLSLWVTLRMRSVGWDTHKMRAAKNNLILYNNLLNILASSGPILLEIVPTWNIQQHGGGLYYKNIPFYFLLHIHIFPLLMIMLLFFHTYFLPCYLFASSPWIFNIIRPHEKIPISTCRYI